MNPEDIREQMVPITVNRLWGQDLLVSDQDLTLTIDRFGERYIEGGVETIANMIDGEGLDQYIYVFNMAGTPGTIPTTLDTYATAGTVLQDNGVPQNKMLSLVINPRMQAKALGFQNNLFNPAKTISEQYMTGRMGEALGFKWSMDQNVSRQTIGTLTGSTPLVNGANQTGSNLVTNGWADSTAILNAGDIISVSLCDGVNPVSFRDTGSWRTFVVTANVVSDGSGNATIPVSPDINIDTTAPFQTVVASPANGAAIYVYNVAAASFSSISGITSAQALAFHRDAFTFVCVPLELPGGLDWSERVTHPKLGVSMRLTRGFDIKENRRYTRLDVLGGWKTTRPEMACRICS
jgi:hypothetical protein